MGNAQKLIVDFARELELDEPKFTNGATAIQFGDMIVEFQADDDRNEITLVSELGGVPADEKEQLELYSRLLKLNSFGIETARGILAVDPNDEFFIFSRSFSADGMEAQQLLNIIDAYLDLVESLQARAFGREEPGESPESPDPSIPAGWSGPMGGGIRG